MKTETLNKLKEKIFFVLLGKIRIDDFESWLYNEEYIIKSIEEDAFVYDLITINYKDENTMSLLKEVAFKKFKDEEYIILFIEMNCKKILVLDQWISIHNAFSEIFSFFDYDKDYFLMWRFYSINVDIGLIDIGYVTIADVIIDIKKLSLQIVNQLKECSTIGERIKFLEEGFEDLSSVEVIDLEELFIKENIKRKWYEFWK